MSKKGGYVIVDLKGQSITAGTPFTLDGVTARLDRAKNKACLLSGFAIGNDEKRDVFVDLQKTEDGYVALFGQYTITIEDDEVTITNGGVLLDDIVDSQGIKRFIEGNLVTQTVEGVTFTYGKWSLSGTHLMIVLAGDVAANTTLANGIVYAAASLPKWLLDKIIPLYANVGVSAEVVDFYTDNWQIQTSKFSLTKTSNIDLRILKLGGDTIEAASHFRIQFDLLIDSSAE